MLIYNHNKELVGIDDETLHHLGYKTLSEFLAGHRDFAELFVKKPGYIQNFQNFPWIDFILHSDAGDIRAIIQNEHVHFSCVLSLSPIFLTDAPENEGYVIQLKQIKALSGKVEPFERAPFAEPSLAPELPQMEAPEAEEPAVLAESVEAPVSMERPPIELPVINPDGSLYEPETHEAESFAPETFEPAVTPVKLEKPMLGDYINQEEQAYLDHLQTDRDYVFDPNIAADELGLPVELIEEFIGDFIQQAHEFKNPLFNANHEEDFDEVHLLSHKLKGVAANLRIEDAFEVLSNVNTSRDPIEIEANLKQFYLILAKMEGKPLPEMMETAAPEVTAPAPKPAKEDLDIYDFSDLLSTTAEEEPAPPHAEEEVRPEALFFDEAPAMPVEEEPISIDEKEEIAAEPPLLDETPETPAEEEEALSFDLDTLPETLTLTEAPPVIDEELPKPKDEERRTFPEEETVSLEDVSPYGIDIIPETEQHLIDDADEGEEYKQVSGEGLKDAVLMEGAKDTKLHYDLTRAAAEIGLSGSFVKGLVKDFVDDAKSKKSEIMQAIDDGDLKKIRAAAFEFKGLADNLRIEDVSRSLTKLLRHEQPSALKREAEHFYSLIKQL